jgi:hypothetical protein
MAGASMKKRTTLNYQRSDLLPPTPPEEIPRGLGSFILVVLALIAAIGGDLCYSRIQSDEFAVLYGGALYCGSMLAGLIALIGSLVALKREKSKPDYLPITWMILILSMLVLGIGFLLPHRYLGPLFF